MPLADSDSAFAGSIPELYDRYLVPLIFQPYAEDLCDRLLPLAPSRVLEIAAGTGVVTRELARRLPAATAIVATDLNQPMLDHAARVGTARPIVWRQADAMQLPFPDESFDAVACQFGVMFFPDKARAFAEARRVLRPGGVFLFNVWDRIEENELVHAVTGALDQVFPENPPRFMHRGPHGYADPGVIRADLARGGLGSVELATVAKRSRADKARDPVIGYCHGSPLRTEIEGHGPDALERGTEAAVAALTRRYGEGPLEGRIQALVVLARRD
jgi:SAM-dependent methyltransferase